MADEERHTEAVPGDTSNPIRKETGVAHFFAAARYSRQGFLRLYEESAFRHELLAFAAGFGLFGLVGASVVEFMTYVVLMLLLFAVEALNTAIEELVDRVSPEISTVGRNAKDLGSFAVFCLILVNAGFVGYTVFF